jgi:hypothetical protein
VARQYAVPGSLPTFLSDTGTRQEATPANFVNETTVTNSSAAPGVGSIVFTGFAPTVTSNAAVSPGAGSIVFTGFAPTITSDTVVSPGAGSVVLTGYAPTLDLTVEPDVGSIVLTGFAPTPLANTAGGPMFTIIV